MNLFDVTHGILLPGQNKPGPRKATASEVKAYLIWLADRRGIWLPHDADFQHGGVWSKSAGEYVLPMPGYSQDLTVTMETLDEAGEVIASQTLPVEPKKGGVIWDREAVRKAFGPIPKRAKGQTIAPTPDAAQAAPEPVHAHEEACAPDTDTPEAVDALHGASAGEIEAAEPSDASGQLPVPHAGEPDLAETVRAMLARIEAIEAALSAKAPEPASSAPIAEQAPAARPARSPAHERAIRRAWAERARRREAVKDAAIAWQVAELRKQKRRASVNAAMTLRRKLEAERLRCASAEAKAEREHQRAWDQWGKRRDNAERARRMIATARGERDLDRGALIAANAYAAKLASEREVAFEGMRAAEVAEARTRADIAKIKQGLADPTQPERASDIARLMAERDQARTSLAAVSARAERQQAALDALAGQFEAMVSRVTRAEAAMRQAGLIAAA